MLARFEKPLLFAIAVIYLLSCFIQIAYRFHITPPDREYLGHHEFYTDDYSIYLSNIFQGQYGRWTLLDKHTSEPHLGTIIHDEYLLWGKLTNIIHLNPIISYHAFRFTGGLILLIVIFQFLKVLFPTSPNKRVLAFLFIIFSFGFPKITQSADGTKIEQYMVWLTELDVFARFVALPHYLLGNIFFLTNVIAFLTLSKHTKIKFVVISVSSILIALVHPVSVVSLSAYYATYLTLSTILRFLLNPKLIKTPLELLNKNEILGFILTVISAAPVLLFYKYLMTIPPWNHMAAWEGVSRYNIPLSEYIGAIGPNFFLAPIGFLIMLYEGIKTNTTSRPLFLVSWILSFFLLVFFSYPFLHISEVRLMQVFIFIPFAILSAYAIFSAAKFFNSKAVIFISITILLIIYMPIYIEAFKSKLFYYSTNSMLAFPPKDWMKGIYYLRDNTPKESVVLGAYMAGTTIPFTSGNTVYTGHLWATLDRTRKEALKEDFFRNKMSESQAYNFLKNEKINYVFNGYQEASMGSVAGKYKFLKSVYSSPSVTIYKFIP